MENMIGQIINGRYRVEASLGSGGLADAYKAIDINHSRFLVLKHLREDLSKDPVFLRSFKPEANHLKLLLHPNIARFHGFEEAGDRVFMLMDFVDGITLRKAILSANAVPFTAPEIMEIMQPVCNALHYAHQLGIVHADLKPANIMIEKSGWVQVTDFGIARLAAGATAASMSGSGTSAYVAPEQMKGLDPTPQTDIYALGVVLYELLTGGERPFTDQVAAGTGFTGEKIRRDLANLKPVSPRSFNPQISAHLESVVLKCLEKVPESRFTSTLELLDALQISLLGETITTSAASAASAASAIEAKVKPTRAVLEAASDTATIPLPERPRKPNWDVYLAASAVITLLIFFVVEKPFALVAPQITSTPSSRSSTSIPAVLSTPIQNIALTTGESAALPDTTGTPAAAVTAIAIPTFTPASVADGNRNGAGNSNNSGLAAIQGEWIYYRNDSDGGKIYRINLDGTQKEQLNSDNSYNININGDWLFYRNDSDAGKLYRMPAGGGEHQKLNDEFSSFINAAGEWIYYQNHTGGDMIYRVRMDGSGRERLTDGQSSFINVYNDRVYFVNDSDAHKIYRMLLDGSGREKISDDFSSHINISGDWLYYMTRNLVFDQGNSSWSTDSTNINRMHLDGSGKEILTTIKNGSINGYINTLGDWIYFIPEISYFSDKNANSINIGGLMFRMHLDESGRETINSSGCNFINIVGDWIYYRKGGPGGKIYRMHLDGSGKESIS